jgi:hypothetical protein
MRADLGASEHRITQPTTFAEEFVPRKVNTGFWSPVGRARGAASGFTFVDRAGSCPHFPLAISKGAQSCGWPSIATQKETTMSRKGDARALGQPLAH